MAAKTGLVVALGLVAAAQSAPLAALPLLMDALDLGAGRLGIAVAAGLATTLLLAPGAGALADRYERPARVARGGLALICAASAALCGYAAQVLDGRAATDGAFAVLLATRVANGVGVAALHPAAQSWLWSGTGGEAGAALQRRASAAQNGGRLLGPLVVGLVGGQGATWTLAALAALGATALAVACLTPAAPGRDYPDPPPPSGAPARTGRRRPDPRLLLVLFFLHVLGGGAQFLLGPLLMARLGLGAAEAARATGWLMGSAAVASVAGNLLARRIPGPLRVSAGVALAVLGAALLAPFADGASVAVAVLLLAAGLGVAIPSALADLMDGSAAGARGRAAGRASTIQAAAYAGAAPAGGLLFAADPRLAAALLPLPAALAAWAALSHRRRAAPGPPPAPRAARR